MSFKKHLIVCALLALVLVFCTGAISAEDSSNATLTSDLNDVVIDEANEEVAAAPDDTGEVATANEPVDNLTSDSNKETLGDDGSIIYVDGDYTGDEEGTIDKPYTLITTAITKSNATKSTIFIKNGEYAINANTKLPTTHGISLIGESKDGVIIKGTMTSYNFMFNVKLNNFDLKFTNLTFLNPYRCVGFKVEGTGNFIVDNCLFNNFTTNMGSYTPFTISCNGSSITNSQIINLNSGYSNGPAYMTYGPGNHKIENTVIDGYVSTYALKQGIITVKANANLEMINSTMSNINAAITTGFIQVAGNFTARNSSFKYNALKNSDCLFYVNKGNLNIEKSSIFHNSGFKYLIQGNGAQSKANINYTGIMGNVYDVNITYDVDTYDLNYNWWGTNDKPNDLVNNWVLMNITFTRNVGEVSIDANFTKYTDGKNITDLEDNLNFPILVKSSHRTVDGEFYLKDNTVSVNFESQGDYYVDVDTGAKVTYLLGAYYIDSSYTGEELGTQDKPFKTISAAVAKTVGWETIFIKNGTYVLDNAITLSNSLSFIGENGVIITGSNKGAFNNPSFLSKQLTLSFTNLTFKDMACNGNNAVLSLGKSVIELNIHNCTFDNCSGCWGVINTECSELNMDNCKILNTKSSSADEGAGAIYLKGNGKFTIENTNITNLQCTGGNANGIVVCNDKDASLTLNNVKIINNTISSTSIISGGKLTVKNSKFQNNIINSDSKTNLIDAQSDSLISDTIFTENIADNLIHVESNTELDEIDIIDNNVENNLFIVKNATLYINNVDIINNTVDNIAFVDETGFLTITESDIKNNTGENGIQLCDDSTIQMSNSEISNNTFDKIIVAAENATGDLMDLTISNNVAINALDINQTTEMTLNNVNIAQNNFTSIFKSLDGSKLVISNVKINNNNITYVFVDENGIISFKDSILSDNNCRDELIYNIGDKTNVTLNYNQILHNNEKAVINNAITFNLDYNWWGTNDKPNEFVDKWVIMDASVTRYDAKAYVTVYLNKFTNGSDIAKLEKNIPDGIIVNVKSSTNDYNNNLTIKNGIEEANFAINNNKYVNFTSDLAKFSESLESNIFYVDINYDGNGTGSAYAPFKHVSDALEVAQDGDTLIVKEGLYCENITWGTVNAAGQSKKGVNIIGENNNVVINLTNNSQIALAINNMELINLTFIGNGAKMHVGVSKGDLNVINCTFDGLSYGYLMTTRGLFYNDGSNSNIENCKFINSVLNEKAITVGFIAQYAGTGDHVIKNCLFDNLTHVASSASTYTRGIIYVGTSGSNKINLDIDNITISNTNCDAECLIGNGASYTTIPGGNLNVKNSRFVNNVVNRYTYSGKEYAGTSLFYNTKGKLTIETSVIKNNTGSLYLIYNKDATSDSIFNYNAIYNNTFTTGIATTTGKHNLDYNWWNASTPAYADANAWIVIDGYVAQEKVVYGDNITIVATFNHYITKDGVMGDAEHIIPLDGEVKFILPNSTNVTATIVKGEVETQYLNITKTETFKVQYEGQEATVSVKLNRMKIELDDDIVVGDNTDIRVLAHGVTGNVTLIIDGEISVLKFNDGVASKTIENITAGTHNVVAILSENATHTSEYEYKTFTVERLSTAINLMDVTVTAGEAIPITLKIAPDATGEIFFDMGDVKFYENLKNGEININFEDIKTGNYTVIVSYEGDEKYTPSNDTFKITVLPGKKETSITLVSVDGYLNVTGILTDADGNPIANATVKYSIGKETFNVTTDNDGSFTISAAYDEIVFEFDETDDYLASNTTVSLKDITPVRQETEIEIVLGDIKIGEDVNVNIIVANVSGELKVYVDDEDGKVIPVTDGKANYTIKAVIAGEHSIVVVYLGDIEHEASESAKDFKVEKLKSEVTVHTTGAKVCQNATIAVNVTAGATGMVIVKIEDNFHIIDLEKGNSIEVALPSEGNYTVIATYAGDGIYAESISDEVILKITDKADANIKIEVPKDVKVGDTITINVTADTNADLEVLINGKPQTIVKDIVTYTVDKAARYSVVVLANETADYNEDMLIATFETEKTDATVTIKLPENIHAGEDIVIGVSTNSDAKVTVLIDGKEQKVVDGTVTVPAVVGHHDIAAYVNATNAYNAANAFESYNVDKLKSEVSINVKGAKIGQNATITVNVTTGATGTVTIYVDNHLYMIDLSKDNTLELALDKAGNYTVVASYVGDDIYDGSISKEAILKITDKADANIKIEVPKDVKVGDTITIKVTADTNASLKVIINSEAQTINNGTVIYVAGLEDKYVVVVESNETADYKEGLYFTSFEATKKDTAISINATDIVVGEKSNVTITLSEGATGYVIVVVDGETAYSVEFMHTNTNSIEIPFDKSGTHTIYATYLGNNEFNVITSKDITVVVTEKEVTGANITLPVNFTIGEASNVTVSIPGATGNVSIIVDGVETVVALENGTAVVTIPEITAGEHSVVVIYSGDENHAAVYDTATFAAPVFATKFEKLTVSSDGFINGYLTDAFGYGIANANVVYKINGVEAKITTDDKGRFHFKVNFPSTVEIAYAGTDKILPANVTITIADIGKTRQSTSVLGNNFTQYTIEYSAGERGGNFTVQLVDDMGKALANKTVLIDYNGKTLERTTNATGYASVQINFNDANRLPFAVAFLGDEDYNATMSVYMITINKKTVTMSATSKSYKASSKSKKYKVTLKTIKGASADGKTYFAAGKKVTLKVNGKTYSAKTNKKGVAKFTLKLTKKGKYTAKLKFAGDGTYKACSKTIKIRVK